MPGIEPEGGAPAQRRRLKDMLAELRAELIANYPATFMGKGLPKVPLKRGVHKDIRRAMPRVDNRVLWIFLEDYCDGPSYHAAMVEGAERIDLNGNATERVTAEEAAHAKTQLRTMALRRSAQRMRRR